MTDDLKIQHLLCTHNKHLCGCRASGGWHIFRKGQSLGCFDSYEAAEAVRDNLLVPCQNTFKTMARQNPNVLINWIRDGSLCDGDLTYAAEELKNVPTSEALIDTLLLLLCNQSPIVREGACLGAENHRDNDQIRQRLEIMRHNDPSPGVRAAADDSLR